MDDMNAFERQVAGEVVRASAPARPVDVAAVFAAIPTATQPPKWRFQTMFSATRFVIAGAILALFGGLLLVAQPFDQSSTSAPGAATDDGSVAPTMFTMRMQESQAQVEGVRSVTEDGHTLVTGYSIFSRIIDATDPRMEGALSMELNWIDRADDVPGLSTTLYEIRNEGGRWVGTSHHPAELDGWHADVPLATTIAFTGLDGYEGFSAYVVRNGQAGGFDDTLYGVIVTGEFPPVYDLPMTQCTDIYPGDVLCDPAWREAP